MSNAELAGMVTRIDASIADSDDRIQEEVAHYIETHPDEVGQQIAQHGTAKIPTFAGDYILTEALLQEIAEGAPELEEVAG